MYDYNYFTEMKKNCLIFGDYMYIVHAPVL